jgi:hypothetical protein
VNVLAVPLLGLVILAQPAVAQLGELQAGVAGAYGAPHAFGAGAGLTFGVAPGRLAYTGLRWTYYFGVAEHHGPTTVRTRVQVVAVDLGLQVPLGVLELHPGVSIGWSQFTQHAVQPEASGSSQEFFGAPGVALEMRAARVALIPQLQYVFAGSPNVPWPVEHRGILFSVRCVWLSELRRIRR